jgi:ABC-type nitrate/sulfonate/bicarbonate transport system permease component
VINTASYYLETPLMFAAVASITVAAVAFFGTIGIVENRFVFWGNYRPEQGD